MRSCGSQTKKKNMVLGVSGRVPRLLPGRREEAGKGSSYYKLPKVHPVRGRKIRHSTTFALGLLFGAFIALLFNIAGSLAAIKLTMTASYVGIRLFRGFFIVFLHIIFMGINTYGWRRAGVNHVLVFQVNPRDNLNYQSLMTVGMGLLVLWAVSAIGYIYAPLFGASQIQFPALLGTVVFIYTFIPMSQPKCIMIMSSRLWLIRNFLRCLTAPFHWVRFADFWLADQMTSLAVVWLDFSYFVCFFTFDAKHWPLPNLSGGERFNWTAGNEFFQRAICHRNPYGIEYLIVLLPFWIRFVQCLRRCFDTKKVLPHLANAGKYATAFAVIGTAVLAKRDADDIYQAVHLATLFIATTYRLTWDILMDWGLLDRHWHESNAGLREKLLYRRPSLYYLAMATNTMLRFFWLLPVLYQKTWATSPIDGQLLLSISGVVECFRRFVWNFFRVENEHVNNCGHFRVQRDASIRQLVPSDFGRKKWSSVDVIVPIDSHTTFGKGCYIFDEADERRLTSTDL